MSDKRPRWQRQVWMSAAGVVLVLLIAAVVTLGSLTLPIRIEQGASLAILFSLSIFIAAALLVFSLIMSRSLLKLWAERRSGQMGSRFKVKMVMGAMGVSLLPVVFLFFYSYALVNRTLNSWFPKPLENANEQNQALLSNLGTMELDRLNKLAAEAASQGAVDASLLARSHAVDAFWTTGPDGKAAGGSEITKTGAAADTGLAPQMVETIGSGAQIWQSGDRLYIVGSAPAKEGTLYIGRRLPDDFLARYADAQAQSDRYLAEKQALRTYKREILLALMLVTLLLLFTTTWVALFLSKQVTVPIQALAEATREISRGNFDHRIEVQAQTSWARWCVRSTV